MPQQVRGVVSHQRGDPVSIETIVIPDPGRDEAVVRVQACAVCHTDLHYREGGISNKFPFLLGHEAAGVVESVGDGVTEVAPGGLVRGHNTGKVGRGGTRQGPALGGAAVTRAPVDHTVTSGTFSLHGGVWDVDNNMWIVDDDEVVIDAAHDVDKSPPGIGGRRTPSDWLDAPVLINPAEAPLRQTTHPERNPDRKLIDGDVMHAGGIELRVLLARGHSPGPSCLHALELGTVFTGDSLFQGGPGATGWSYTSSDTIIESIRTALLTLPGDTIVRAGTATAPLGAPRQRTSQSGLREGSDLLDVRCALTGPGFVTRGRPSHDIPSEIRRPTTGEACCSAANAEFPWSSRDQTSSSNTDGLSDISPGQEGLTP